MQSEPKEVTLLPKHELRGLRPLSVAVILGCQYGIFVGKLLIGIPISHLRPWSSSLGGSHQVHFQESQSKTPPKAKIQL